jgi:hypothetical protein
MKFGYFTLSDNHYADNPRSSNQFITDIIDEDIIHVLKKVEAAGFDEVILYFNVGLKPHGQVKDEMARFMEEVAPFFR